MEANLAAIRVVRALASERRPATESEQRLLARWSGWGAVPQIFDEARDDWAGEREQLRELLDESAYAAARRTTINAHYTDASYVRAVWDAVIGLGFEGDRVLEPGAGSGTFIGMAPSVAKMTGVELDPTTASIARGLYPEASIHTESFADSRFPDGYFDAVVGNVPFADVRLHDPRHNGGHHSIHNHFIIKSLALTRPGGIVAVLTSHFTLDAQNPAARREMNELADLVGAVRLPTGAHRRAAGTDVITDLLVLRRRDPGVQPEARGWETTTTVRLDDQTVRLNNYFLEHPTHVLGDMAVGSGMHSASSLRVNGDLAQTARALEQVLAEITFDARNRGLTQTERAHETRLQRPAELAGELLDGHIAAGGDGTFTVVSAGAHVPFEVPGSLTIEFSSLLTMRDQASALLATEATTAEETSQLEGLRAELKAGYDEYRRRYGAINRFKLRATGRNDRQTDEPRYARVVPAAVAKLRSDPSYALVLALEEFDEATQTATAAALLTRRVITPRAPVLGAETPADALAVCLDTHGKPDLTVIANLLGLQPAEAREALGDLVFDAPAAAGLVSAPEYLSGNVREKLELARAAAADNTRLTANVSALEAVLPRDLGMDDIEARLGAAWIDADTHGQFLADLLGDPSAHVEHPGGAIWAVKAQSRSVAATSEWGTERMPAPAILRSVLEQRPIRVTDEVEGGGRVVNPVDTAAAQEKADAMQERFAEWVWEEPARADRLVAEYNLRLNSLVLRDYTREGSRLTLPGLSTNFRPHPHQRIAVARMIGEPAVGLFHEVGAGKTAEMVMGVMELKRLGMVSKPAVIVPNHMLEQFSREWLQLYPQARFLAASTDDLSGDKRRALVARIATNNWDAVIMTRSAFERLPMSLAAQKAYVERELERLRALLDRARDSAQSLTVKRIEKLVESAQERIKEKLDAARDPGIKFEHTGIDYLVIDEVHGFKNLRPSRTFPTRRSMERSGRPILI